MTNFDHIYQELLSKIEFRMYQVIPDKAPKSLYEPFKYLISGGGKRIRPILALLSCGAVGGNIETALDCAAAIEIMHNFTLVHDDIMDQSNIRRGRETVHIKWDQPSAILSGDVMVGYAYKLLPKSRQHERADQIFDLLTNGLIEVCEGQAFDMEFNTRRDVVFEEYINMITKKTAKLLETSALIGAHCGLADDKSIGALSNFALNLGLAFQIHDDLLDITADQSKLGKTVGLDIIEGKKTCLIIKSLELAEDPKDVLLLKQFYENNGLPIQRVPEFDEMFQRLGIYDFAKERSKFYSKIAENSLNDLENNEYIEILRTLLKRLLNRES